MKSFLTLTLGLALASLTFAAAGCSDNKSATETTTTAPATGSPMAADSASTSPYGSCHGSYYLHLLHAPGSSK